MADIDYLYRYADLLVGTCLGISHGMKLLIRCEIPHRKFALLVASAAWRKGAGEVKIRYMDPRFDRAEIELIDDAWLESVSELTRDGYRRMAQDAWACVIIMGEEDPEAFEGVSAEKLKRWDRSRAEEFEPYRLALMKSLFPWCIASMPTEAWARWVFSTSGRAIPPEPVAALWDVLLPVLRLDRPDPSVAWRTDILRLDASARKMSAHRFDRLHFFGPGTDLVVGLSPASSWKCGLFATPDGKQFTPNIPSEEIFSTPDYRQTEGRVAVTKPVRIMGLMVEGAWLRFEHGEVVESGATRNADALAGYLAQEIGQRRLGEVALVECTSPVAKSGLVFGNILLDENAACHIALGYGIEETFEGVADMDSKARGEAGFNTSINHADLMIGSAFINVDGLDARGRRVPVMRSGEFVLKDESPRQEEH